MLAGCISWFMSSKLCKEKKNGIKYYRKILFEIQNTNTLFTETRTVSARINYFIAMITEPCTADYLSVFVHFLFLCISLYFIYAFSASNVLTLFVWHVEGHPACKNPRAGICCWWRWRCDWSSVCLKVGWLVFNGTFSTNRLYVPCPPRKLIL